MKESAKTVASAGIMLALLTGLSAAEPWKIDINSNVTTALNTYSDSWTGGEAGSFTWASQFLGTAERQLSPKLNTKATLNLQFGQTKIQDKTSKVWSIPQKSTDLIDAQELFRFTLGLWADPFISARAISQFLDGRDITTSHYGNPWDITEAAGGSRTLQKSETIEWSTRLGGAARQLVDRYKPDSPSGTHTMDVTNDGGVEFNMDLKAANKAKWVSLLSSLKIYEALVSSKADEVKGTPIENDWRYPHMTWENTLTLTLAKYLMLNISAYAYYDREKSNDIRLKETFSAGLTYMYSRK